MRRAKWATRAALAFACAAAACAFPIRTKFDADPTADFSGYWTFAWITDQPFIKPGEGRHAGAYVSPLEEQRIRSAVERELTAKGYRLVDRPLADLVLAFSVGSEQKVRVEQTGSSSTVYYPGYGYGTWYGDSPVRAYSYTEGTLALEFYDRRSRQAVWVGLATKRMSKSDDSAEVIDKAVAAILKDFPNRGIAQDAAPG